MADKAKAVPQDVMKDWPQEGHPTTGEPFTKCEHINRNRPIHEVFHGPPDQPERAVYDYNEWTDQMVYVRDLTDEEYKQAWEEYEAAAKKWYATQGRLCVPGIETVTGKFLTDRGDWAEGQLVGENRWLWTRWGVS